MPTTLVLSQEAYEALIKLAADGTRIPDPCSRIDQEKALALDAFLRDIEKSNGIVRSLLNIQWQDANTKLVPTARFPEVWPPELRYRLELISRRITQDDVLAVIRQRTKNPVNILVTPDPAGLVGWTTLSQYFIQQ